MNIKERAKELLKLISPWPWYTHNGKSKFHNVNTGEEETQTCTCGQIYSPNGVVADSIDESMETYALGEGYSKEQSLINAEFIASAPEIINELIKEVERRDKVIEILMGNSLDHYTPHMICIPVEKWTEAVNNLEKQ